MNTSSNQVAIFGATSAMAAEAGKLFAADGAELFLIARNGEKLEVIANDLLARGALRVETIEADLSDVSLHQEIAKRIEDTYPNLSVVLIAHGILGDEEEAQENFLTALDVYNVNFLSAVSLLTIFSKFFGARGEGVLAAITSVAGDRGRKGNFVYGSSKGALSLFMSGLRGKLLSQGVTVTDIRPGFVDTPMTAHLPKGPLFASAQMVGKGIYDAICSRKDIVYLPWFWRYIMFVIKAIPESLFKRTNI